MIKLEGINAKKIVKVLRYYGFFKIGSSGKGTSFSRRNKTSGDYEKPIVLRFHSNVCAPEHVVMSIIKRIGISEEEFLKRIRKKSNISEKIPNW